MFYFWKKYAEYYLHTTLTETELIEGLTRACPRNDLSWAFSRRAWQTCFHGSEQPVFLRHAGDPLCLVPIYGTRNMLLGYIFIAPRDAPDGGCDLHIIIHPPRSSLVFTILWLAFLLFAGCVAAATEHWKLLVFPITMLLFMWGLLLLCRHCAAGEIPALKTAFALTIDRLERRKR